MVAVKFIATSSYLPEEVLTNHDWAKLVDTSDEWIRQRTGIRQRHFAQQQQTSDLAIRAAQRLIEKASVDVSEIGFIIVATMTPDAASPSCAALVQSAIQAENAFAFDLSAACSGFVFALSTAYKMLHSSPAQYGIVIGAETMLQSLNWQDRSTAILFGDGAGAVLLEKSSEELLYAETLQTNGNKADALVAGQRLENHQLSTMTMDGRGVYELVSREVPKNIQQTLQKAQLTVEDVDLFLLHQANARLIEQVAKKLKQPIEKFPMNIAHVGNTSAASVPILLDELASQHKIQLGEGKTILLAGFGGGLSWGSILITI